MIAPDYREVAAQLRNPTGADGLKTAERMADNNSNMIAQTIKKLQVEDGDCVMEIGPGGGMHLPLLLEKANNIVYKGVDISSTMVALAQANNSTLMQHKEANFIQVILESGFVKFPFEENSFDSVFTVNTIYFWDNATEQALEIARVLKPEGTLLLCFADKTFMQNMPFTQYNFHLYTIDEATELLVRSGFEIASISSELENITGIHGEKFDREIHFIAAKKRSATNR